VADKVPCIGRTLRVPDQLYLYLFVSPKTAKSQQVSFSFIITPYLHLTPRHLHCTLYCEFLQDSRDFNPTVHSDRQKAATANNHASPVDAAIGPCSSATLLIHHQSALVLDVACGAARSCPAPHAASGSTGVGNFHPPLFTQICHMGSEEHDEISDGG
jgi:hypothetical protein